MTTPKATSQPTRPPRARPPRPPGRPSPPPPHHTTSTAWPLLADWNALPSTGPKYTAPPPRHIATHPVTGDVATRRDPSRHPARHEPIPAPATRPSRHNATSRDTCRPRAPHSDSAGHGGIARPPPQYAETPCRRCCGPEVVRPA